MRKSNNIDFLIELSFYRSLKCKKKKKKKIQSKKMDLLTKFS